jgi:hypothetical protein
MGRLDRRVQRLEAAETRSVREMSDEELTRALAEILAPMFQMSVDAVLADLPSWERDGRLAALYGMRGPHP